MKAITRDQQSARATRVHIAKVEEEPTVNAWCMAQQQANASQPNSDQASLTKVISLLEKLLASQEQTGPQTNETTGSSALCRVCKAHDHSTKAHCFKEGLCFRCYKTGQRGFECPGRKQVNEARKEPLSGPSRALN